MGFWQKLFLLAVGMVTFVFMIWFIFLFPSKIKHARGTKGYIGGLVSSIGRGANLLVDNAMGSR